MLSLFVFKNILTSLEETQGLNGAEDLQKIVASVRRDVVFTQDVYDVLRVHNEGKSA